MTSVAEIVAAVKQLPLEEKHALLEQLGSIMGGLDVISAENDSPRLPADFTRRLVEHFHRAKRVAVCGGR